MLRVWTSVLAFCALLVCLVQVKADAQPAVAGPSRVSGHTGVTERGFPLRVVPAVPLRSAPSSVVSLNSARQSAVANAWRQERILVGRTGRGTRVWSPAEKQELLATGRVKGYEGHHINDASTHPSLAGRPDNIAFVNGRRGHLSEHGGSFRNSTRGSMVSRQKMLESYRWSVSSQNIVIGGVQILGGGVLIWQFLPEATASFDMYRRGGRQDSELLWETIDSSLMVGSGAALSVSGTARVAAYAIGKSGVVGMHSLLGPLRATSRVAAPIAVALLVAEGGVHTYRWNKGYISTPDFVKRVSVAAAATAGGVAGAATGAEVGQAAEQTWGGVVGGVLGGIGGAIAGAAAASGVVGEYYAEIDHAQQEAYLDHLYSFYGTERINVYVEPESSGA